MSLQPISFPAGVSFAVPNIPFNQLIRRQNDPSLADLQKSLLDLSNVILQIGTSAPLCIANVLNRPTGGSETCQTAAENLNKLTACITMRASETPTVEGAVRNLECVCDVLSSDDLKSELDACAEDACTGDEENGAKEWIKRVRNDGGEECKRVEELVKDFVDENTEDTDDTEDGAFTTTITTTIDGTPTTQVIGIATAPPAEFTTTTMVITDAEGEEQTTVLVISRNDTATTTGEPDDFPEQTPGPTTTPIDDNEDEDNNNEDENQDGNEDENQDGDDNDSAGVALSLKKSLLWAAVGLPVVMAMAI